MVAEQIARRGVKARQVLRAMARVPRHRFVPLALQGQAYADRPLPIGHRQTISQPYVVAFMSEALRVRKGHRVLEIGTGSGYQAAVLAELGAVVYTIEIVPPLAREAASRLRQLGYGAIHRRIGDGYGGWPQAAPFDRIILTAAPPKIPAPLLKQLDAGGILVAPVGRRSQELLRVTRKAKGFERERLLGVRFVPMTGKAEKP